MGLPTLWRLSFENSQPNHIFLQLVNVNSACKRNVVLNIMMVGPQTKGLKHSEDISMKDGAMWDVLLRLSEQPLTSVVPGRGRLGD